MKKFFLIITLIGAFISTYSGKQGDDLFKAKITQQKDDTKIYDPQRGIKAKLQVEFTDDGQLKLRGSIPGIGESVYWKKI